MFNNDNFDKDVEEEPVQLNKFDSDPFNKNKNAGFDDVEEEEDPFSKKGKKDAVDPFSSKEKDLE